MAFPCERFCVVVGIEGSASEEYSQSIESVQILFGDIGGYRILSAKLCNPPSNIGVALALDEDIDQLLGRIA
jgi:hypothetical protein